MAQPPRAASACKAISGFPQIVMQRAERLSGSVSSPKLRTLLTQFSTHRVSAKARPGQGGPDLKLWSSPPEGAISRWSEAGPSSIPMRGDPCAATGCIRGRRFPDACLLVQASLWAVHTEMRQGRHERGAAADLGRDQSRGRPSLGTRDSLEDHAPSMIRFFEQSS